MSRGCSFGPTKQEREADDRRRRVKDAVLALLAHVDSVTAQDVYLAVDHRSHPTISPANSGNILSALAREGVLVSVGPSQYTLPLRRVHTLPVDGSSGLRTPTKEMLMGGRSYVRRRVDGVDVRFLDVTNDTKAEIFKETDDEQRSIS